MHEELTEVAVHAARRASRVLLRHFRDSTLEIEAKGDHDFVTRADRESESEIVAALRRSFPDHHILAEEAGLDEGDASDFHWYVDPLDGTTNFLHGLPVFSISIACRHRDEMVSGVVYDPTGENLFTATRGAGARWNGRAMRVARRDGLEGAFLATGFPFKARQALDVYLDIFRAVFLSARAIRRCGSAALDLAYTAAGVYDGFFELRLSPWDFAAGTLLLREAGGVVTDLDGGDAYFASGNLVAGAADLHRELLATIRRFADEERLHALDPPRNNFGPELVGT